jgi:hypothetical protein
MEVLQEFCTLRVDLGQAGVHVGLSRLPLLVELAKQAHRPFDRLHDLPSRAARRSAQQVCPAIISRVVAYRNSGDTRSLRDRAVAARALAWQFFSGRVLRHRRTAPVDRVSA